MIQKKETIYDMNKLYVKEKVGNGDTYTGHWHNDMMNGTGTMYERAHVEWDLGHSSVHC